MRSISPQDLVLLHREGSVPQLLINGWLTEINSGDPIERARRTASQYRFRRAMGWCLLLGATGLLGVALRDFQGGSHWFNIGTLLAMLFAAISGPLFLASFGSTPSTFAHNYAQLLAVVGMTATQYSSLTSDEQKNVVIEALRKQASRLRLAESEYKAAPDHWHYKRVLDIQRDEFDDVYAMALKFRLVNRQSGKEQFLGVVAPDRRVA